MKQEKALFDMISKSKDPAKAAEVAIRVICDYLTDEHPANDREA